MWKHIYDDNLRLKPCDGPVLITESALNPLANRQRVTEVFFEHLEVPAFFMSIQGVLALFAAGFTTGFVLNSGAGAGGSKRPASRLERRAESLASPRDEA